MHRRCNNLLRRTASCIAALAALSASQSLACGQRGDPCTVPLGDYYVAQPSTPASGKRAAIVHFHGGGGDGFAVVEDRWMIEPMLARGYVVIAPQGQKRGTLGNGWTFREDHLPGRDELAFLRDILSDAATRFSVDPARVLVTGHSVGGSITWYIACRAPQEFAAFAPVAGGFWRPHPQSCNGPVKMLHTHGWDDPVVPLEGRTFRRPNFTAQQGDIFEGLQMWRLMNGCTTQAPARTTHIENYSSRIWDNCESGSYLQLVLHPGGHDTPRFWPQLVMDWFETQTRRNGAGR